MVLCRGNSWKRRFDVPTVDIIFAAALMVRGVLLVLEDEHAWAAARPRIWKSILDVSEGITSAKELVKIGVKLPLPMELWKHTVMRCLLKWDMFSKPSLRANWV